ncbi:MAG: hypothetical protein QF915_03750 [Candidatus Woesearchaeota archaeon]|jgi:hypothetical protein|nr:hypothetical protein [Candidatus Woesearchaeota archaeon]|tara:strand:- start:47 stop:871 length:825 start_codon:yes stop_codon:yes gene_type:complete
MLKLQKIRLKNRMRDLEEGDFVLSMVRKTHNPANHVEPYHFHFFKQGYFGIVVPDPTCSVDHHQLRPKDLVIFNVVGIDHKHREFYAVPVCMAEDAKEVEIDRHYLADIPVKKRVLYQVQIIDEQPEGRIYERCPVFRLPGVENGRGLIRRKRFQNPKLGDVEYFLSMQDEGSKVMVTDFVPHLNVGTQFDTLIVERGGKGFIGIIAGHNTFVHPGDYGMQIRIGEKYVVEVESLEPIDWERKQSPVNGSYIGMRRSLEAHVKVIMHVNTFDTG